MRNLVRRYGVACVLAVLIAVALLAAAVSGGKSAQAAPASKPKVGLVMKSLANEFFQVMNAGAQTYANKHKSQFAFKSVGMKDERDFAAQVSAVENFIAQKYNVIVVAPADSKAMVTPIKKAVAAGIVVINIDVSLDKGAMKKAGINLPFFGPDNVKGAFLSGQVLAKKLGRGGKVVLLEGNPEADNAKQRHAGFLKVARQYGLKVLADNTAHWDTTEANTLMTNYLTRFPDVQGVMAANDSMALGVVKALDTVGKSGKIAVVGFDNIPAVKPLLKQGKMLATIDQYGAQQAVNGINYGLRTLRGKKFHGWVKTKITLIKSPSAGH